MDVRRHLVDDAGTTLWLEPRPRRVSRPRGTSSRRHVIHRTASRCHPPPTRSTCVSIRSRRASTPYSGSRSMTFEGGCIVYRYRFAQDSEPALVTEADRAVSSLSRAIVVSHGATRPRRRPSAARARLTASDELGLRDPHRPSPRARACVRALGEPCVHARCGRTSSPSTQAPVTTLALIGDSTAPSRGGPSTSGSACSRGSSRC